MTAGTSLAHIPHFGEKAELFDVDRPPLGKAVLLGQLQRIAEFHFLPLLREHHCVHIGGIKSGLAGQLMVLHAVAQGKGAFPRLL